MALLPVSATADARRLLVTRALRGFVDGAVSVYLSAWLLAIGRTETEVGAVVTATLLGSALLTTVVGLSAHRLPRRGLLVAAGFLMAATGAAFAGASAFVVLLVIAFVGTLNPSAGDVSVFLPVEQSVLAGAVSGPDRTLLFAIYNLAGSLAGAAGALAGGLPDLLAARGPASVVSAQRAGFLVYAAIGLAVAAVYRTLDVREEAAPGARAPLARSRSVVLRLAALFSLDSFGGGFAVQALLVLWLQKRFGLSTATSGAIFFASGLAAAFSQLVSARIARRIGLVRTMVYTHLPANVFLVVAGVMPTAGLSVFFLLLRASLSSMDVPARQSYVMAVVPPEERAAASSVTNVPRSLASAIPPLFVGWILGRTTFGWPLVIAGVLKGAYDLLLLWQFHAHPAPEDPVRA